MKRKFFKHVALCLTLSLPLSVHAAEEVKTPQKEQTSPSKFPHPEPNRINNVEACVDAAIPVLLVAARAPLPATNTSALSTPYPFTIQEDEGQNKAVSNE